MVVSTCESTCGAVLIPICGRLNSYSPFGVANALFCSERVRQSLQASPASVLKIGHKDNRMVIDDSDLNKRIENISFPMGRQESWSL
jgi:hypothetical protein